MRRSGLAQPAGHDCISPPTMSYQSRIFRPQNYSTMHTFTVIVIVAGIFSVLNEWGNWEDVWFLPAMSLAFWIIAYVTIFKLWTIEITSEGYLISKSLKFQTDFKVKIDTIERIEKGFYFLVPQTLPVIWYRSATTGKLLHVLLRPPAWGEKVIGQIMKELITINPSIQLVV